jgi:hypothetical protein
MMMELGEYYTMIMLLTIQLENYYKPKMKEARSYEK